MPAARTNRLLLLAAATIGVVAGAVGIGASILGDDTEAERSEAEITRAEAERIAQGEVAGPIDRTRISAEGWEVRIDTDSGHTDVLIDPTTGEVLQIDD